MNGQRGDARIRERIAALILLASIVGISLASVVAILMARPEGRSEMARLVFASVLPLFGTWVGTVLAFYFARENLQAATDSTIRLAGRLEPSTPVSDVMISRDKMHTYTLQAGQDPKAVEIADLKQTMDTAGVWRLPIINESGAVLYIVHDSTVSRFAEAIGKRATELTDETLGDLLDKPACKDQVKAIGFVAPQADLGQARAAMRSVESCNDVFVTKQGQPSDPVIGWLTNTQLAGLE